MALFTLALSGDGEAMEAVNAVISLEKPELSDMLSFARSPGSSPESFQEINLFKLGEDMESVFALLQQSRPKEAKKKIMELLNVHERVGWFNVAAASVFAGFYEFGIKRNVGMLTAALGMAEMQLGNLKEAISCSHKALGIGEVIGDGQIITTALGNLGVACMEMDRYYDALEYFHKSLDMMEEYIDPWRKKNRVLYNISILYHKLGNTAESRKYADLALSSLKEENDPVGTAWCLNASGINILLEGDDGTAEGFFLEALESCKASGDRQTEASVLSNIGFLHQSRGEYEKAIEALDKALGIFKDVGNRKDAASALVNKAYLYMEATG